MVIHRNVSDRNAQGLRISSLGSGSPDSVLASSEMLVRSQGRPRFVNDRQWVDKDIMDLIVVLCWLCLHACPRWRVTSWGKPLASCSMSESVSGETHPPGPRHWVSQLSALRELNGPRCEINVKSEGSNLVKVKVPMPRCSPALSIAFVTLLGVSTLGKSTRGLPRFATTVTCYSGLDLRREKRNDQC